MTALKIAAPKWAKPLLEGERGRPRYRGAKGGRASGKSHFFAECVVERLIQDPDSRIVCIREIQKSLKFSAKQLIVDKIAASPCSHMFEIQSTEIKRIGGSGIIIFQGMQDHTADSVKSLEGFDVAWVEEAQSMSKKSLELLDPTIRKDGSEIWFSWNPFRKDDPVEEIFHQNDNSVLVHCTFADNPFVNDATFEMAKMAYKKNVQKFNHVWLGDYVGDVEGALWTGDMIERCRIDEHDVPDLSRIVVAIDPAVTGGKTSDETGIVIAGRHAQSGNFYVLEDASFRGSPDRWIKTAIEKYHQYKADRIIAEVNNGGDLVETLLRNTDRAVSYRAVRATRGKMLRAEPIAALYEDNKVFHADRMRELEEQMIFYDGSGNISPDRLDALVWALTDLSQTSGQAVWRIN